MKILTDQELKSLEDKIYDLLMSNPENGMGEMGDCRDAAENLVKEWKEETDSKFPNGFTSWMETHHEVVEFIALHNSDKENEATVIFDIRESMGTTGLYELADQWTKEFELLNKGREWDGEFFDEIHEFLTVQNLKS